MKAQNNYKDNKDMKKRIIERRTNKYMAEVGKERSNDWKAKSLKQVTRYLYLFLQCCYGWY